MRGDRRSRRISDGRQNAPRLDESKLRAALLERVGTDLELTHSQSSAVEQLRARAARAKLRDVPEGLLQRCCIAADNDVDEAYTRLRDIVRWRESQGVQHILEDPEALAAEKWYRDLLQYSIPGRDKRGRSVMIEAIGQWDMDALDKAARESKEAMLRAHVVVCERLLSQAQEAASERSEEQQQHGHGGGRAAGAHARVPGFVAVLDMEGISLRQNPLAYPQLLGALREVSKINARYYPEAVEHVFVVNAPRLFQSIWSTLAPFVLPSSGVKVDVLPRGDYSTLVRECGEICLPKQLGGKLPAHTPPYKA